jgi:acyl-CoA synthetase (AMP-forming)/AMP-acid ligase II
MSERRWHFHFADLFEQAADKVPDRVAVIDERRKVTYAELEVRSNQLAHALAAAGVQAHDHVAIYAQNCLEWVEALLAIYKIRCSIVNVNFRYTEAELRYMLDNSDAVAVIYAAEYEPILASARDAQPRLSTFLRIGGDDGAGVIPEAVDYEAALAAQSPERDFGERSDDDVYLLYTGGTTGMPKGVMWRMEDVFFALGGGVDVFTNEKVPSPSTLAERIDPAAPGGLVTLQLAPLMHGAGQFGLKRTLIEGNTAVLPRQFDAAQVWQLVHEHRVNVVGFIGDAMARPLKDAYEAVKDEIDISCLASFSSTAAIFSPTLKAWWRATLPEHTLMLDAIGSTESGMNGYRIVQPGDSQGEGITTVNASLDSVVLNDDLEPVQPGSGEVGRVARGGNIPLGYYKDEAKTAATFVVDRAGKRWSIPGDFARLEADGTITLLGRGSVSINSGGEKIFPEEVEGALKAHPAVFDAIVVGVPDERWGQAVCALVQPEPGTEPTLEALQATARELIAGYKVPRRVFIVEEVPRHPNAKPDYRRAQELAQRLSSEHAPA